MVSKPFQAVNNETSQDIFVFRQHAILDYILSHVDKDERPYLEVSVLGTKILGLLDSGATNTILGGSGWRKIQSLNLPLDSSNNVSCTVANGQTCRSIGIVEIPFQVENQIKIVRTLVIPELEHYLILGADFWRKMGIVPDLRRGNWKFSKEDCVIINTITLKSKNELTCEQLHILNNLVEESFIAMGDKLGCTSLMEHEITTDASPIKQRYYPVSPIMQQHINQELDKLLEEDIVEKSHSAWSSPILLVKKKDQSYRFCVDYRKLNGVTQKDAYPLPYVSATLDKLRDAQYLSSLDIKSAYFQVPLSEASKPLTAFTVPNRGLFQFKRLPMGLANSPATFQRLIDRVLGADLEPHVLVYLDDIIVVTNNFEKHIEVLSEVFKRLREANLTVAKEKCFFCRPQLKYLGYVIDSSGLHTDPEKISAIINIPTPKSVSEVRRIIGTASWYRRFVPNFSSLVAPLCNLLRKNRPFLWTHECDASFQALKEHLITAPVLTCPDFCRPFTIQTDASAFGIGAVLSQECEEGEKVICYLSRSLTPQERNFSTTERECLAVLWAVEKLRAYVEGSRFRIITDHHSLVWLNKLQSPTGRLARWAVRLQQFDYEIIHRKGKDNVVPDTLSRSVPVVDSIQEASCTDNPVQDAWYNRLVDNIKKFPKRYSNWRCTEGRLFKYVKPKYQNLAYPEDFWKEVVHKNSRSELIKEAHCRSCHSGVMKTTHLLFQKYFWPKMKIDVATYIRRCKVCHAIKPEQKAPIGFNISPQKGISRPFELLCADLVGPLPRSKSGYQYIFVVADCFSKFSLFFPLRSATGSAISRILENDILLVFGCPDAFIVDNGVQFRSKEFVKLMSRFNVRIKYTALYHPQANPCERINKVLKTMLRAYVSENHRTWEEHLPEIGYAIRANKHEVTKLSPNFIVFGRELPHRGKKENNEDEIQFNRSTEFQNRHDQLEKVHKDVTTRLQHAYDEHKVPYNLRRRDRKFLPNEIVWRRNYSLSDASRFYSASLGPKFLGPFMIKKAVSPWTYLLVDSDGNHKGIWHAKDLKAHPPDSQTE